MQVAAGMSKSLIVEIFAMAVGVVGECGVGSVQHEVEIVSEAAVMYLPVKANILYSMKHHHMQCIAFTRLKYQY